MCQNFRNVVRPANIHRNTISQAVTFIKPLSIKFNPVQKVFIRLLDRGNLAYGSDPLATYHLSAGGSLSTSPSAAALRSHTPLLLELARQVKLGHCPRSVYRKWLDMQADYLIHQGMRADLLKLIWSEPANWSGKFWVRVALEMIGVRSRMSRVLGRPRPG